MELFWFCFLLGVLAAFGYRVTEMLLAAVKA